MRALPTRPRALAVLAGLAAVAAAAMVLALASGSVAVTAGDVQEVARRYFNPQDQSLIVVGDPSIAPQLKAYGEFRTVTPD